VVSPLVIIEKLLPVLILLIGGALARRVGVVRRDDDAVIMRLTVHVLFPCFILDNVLGNTVVRDPSVVVWGFGLGAALVVIGIGTGLLGGRLLGLERGTGQRTFALSTGVQNFGYTAIPVIDLLWPGSGVLGVLFVHNLGVEITMWTLGVMLLAGRGNIPWLKLINGPAVAIVLALLLVFSGLDRFVIGPPRVALEWLGRGAFPVAIFITGALMMDFLTQERPSLRIAGGSVLIRLMILPIFFLAAARWLPIATELRQVLVVQAVMPAAMTPILMAKLYAGRPGIAVQSVATTTFACFATIPIILSWALTWLDL
jgi:predicted permease